MPKSNNKLLIKSQTHTINCKLKYPTQHKTLRAAVSARH